MSIWIGAGGRFRRKLVWAGKCRLHGPGIKTARPPLRAAVPVITERRLRQRFLPQCVKKDPPISVFWFVSSWLFRAFPWVSGETKASPWFEGSTQTKFLYCPLLISARSLSGFQTTVVFELLFSIDMTRLNALSSISTVPLWFVNAESNSPRIVRSPFSV